MDAVELRQPDFWDESSSDRVVLGNPRRQGDFEGVAAAAASVPETEGHVIIETSGSAGAAKFACLSVRALNLSARAVNAHLGALPEDRWLCALPTFHVGGVGIYARAFHSGSEVFEFEGGWNARNFAQRVHDVEATLTSLVPTQVADLVQIDIESPASLRAVIVGGGHLPAALAERAMALGWPLLRSYGMTEAASQIATEAIEPAQNGGAAGALPILSHWQVRGSHDGRLEIRGDSLFSGYLYPAGSGGSEQRFESAREPGGDGWFKTSDVGEMGDGWLRVSGRADRSVKILGELVDVDRVERAFLDLVDPTERENICIESVADERRGSRLVIVAGGSVDGAQVETLRLSFNHRVAALEKLDRVHRIATVPRSPLGKVRRRELRRLARLR